MEGQINDTRVVVDFQYFGGVHVWMSLVVVREWERMKVSEIAALVFAITVIEQEDEATLAWIKFEAVIRIHDDGQRVPVIESLQIFPPARFHDSLIECSIQHHQLFVYEEGLIGVINHHLIGFGDILHILHLHLYELALHAEHPHHHLLLC